MPRRRSFGPIPLDSLWTLVRHEARVLAQNRMACVVILLTLIAAAIVRIDRAKHPLTPREVCYVVYWQKDDWVRRLEAAAECVDDSQRLRIEVVPAARLTGTDGTIRYPRGSHSIQIRPTQPTPNERGGWLIWYWYSGRDPSVMWPYAQWFQQVTLEHFSDGVRWRERASPLRPELVLLGEETHITVDSLLEPQRMDAALLWLVLFFTAFHLPNLSLAESRAGRTIDALVVTPAGWQGVAVAKRLFYGTLAMTLAAAIAALLNPAVLLSFSFWLTIGCGTLIYLGVSFVIASWSESVASASIGAMIYLFCSGLLFTATSLLPYPFGTTLSQYAFAEGSILQSLHTIWNPAEQGTAWLLGALIVWAALWQLAGEVSYRRLRRR